jgi:hypothetical protein
VVPDDFSPVKLLAGAWKIWFDFKMKHISFYGLVIVSHGAWTGSFFLMYGEMASGRKLFHEWDNEVQIMRN